MKKSIKVTIEYEPCKLIPDIVYSHVPAFFGNSFKALYLSLLSPVQFTQPLPLIVWINGGGWRFMDKDIKIPNLVTYAQHGYAVASIQYRVSGEAIFPAQIEDIKTAIRFLRAHADKFGIDTERIGVMGESAGGHLAALVGTTGNINDFTTEEWRGHSSKVKAVVDWFGPTDLLQLGKFPSVIDHNSPTGPESLLIGGSVLENRDKCQKANPITYISKETPPFLILHGDNDQVVPFNQSELLYEALIANGTEATLYRVEGAKHAGKEFFQPEIIKIISDFFDCHLKA